MSRYDPPVSDYQDFSCFKHPDPTYPWVKAPGKLIIDDQRRLDWIPSVDDIKNSYGCIRWFKIRGLYFSRLVDIDFCVNAYHTWRDDREDLWLDAISKTGDRLTSVFVAAAKRGNEWYKERLQHKFSFFEDLPPIHFFNESWGRKTTPMLFITLTVDPALVGNDLDQGWDNIGLELHLFETKLRQEYGRFVKLRVWEAHESGYPHSHVVYYFLDRSFEVWEHFDKKKNEFTGNRTWRIADKHRKKIRSFWGLGPNIDIQGVSDTLGAFSEVRKYITKSIWTKKGDLTNTLCCLHRKQIYWLSQCDYVKKRAQDPDLKKLKTVAEKSNYLALKVEKWARKDFIGAIWGSNAYMDFYKKLHEHGHDEGLAEPGLSALVTRALHSCNKDLADFDHFEYKGSFRHEDLSFFVPGVSDEPEFWADPPDDVRLYFGVDHIHLSRCSISRRQGFFGVDPDREDY